MDYNNCAMIVYAAGFMNSTLVPVITREWITNGHHRREGRTATDTEKLHKSGTQDILQFHNTDYARGYTYTCTHKLHPISRKRFHYLRNDEL